MGLREQHKIFPIAHCEKTYSLRINEKGDERFKMNFFYISFYCTTSLITDYKYTYVTINGL